MLSRTKACNGGAILLLTMGLCVPAALTSGGCAPSRAKQNASTAAVIAPAPRAPRPHVNPCEVAAARDREQDTLALARARDLLATALAQKTTIDHREIAELEASSRKHAEAGRVAVAAQQRKEIDRLRGLQPVLEAVRAAGKNATADYTFCEADPQGAWAIVQSRVEYVPEDYDWRAPWKRNALLALARIGNDGEVRTAPIKTFLGPEGPFDKNDPLRRSDDMNCCADQVGGGGVRAMFRRDVDGDGVPEVALQASWYSEGDGESWTALFAASPAGPQVIATDFDGIQDVTGDGFVDLLYEEKFDAGKACGSGFSLHGTGPVFIAHNQHDGTFSKDDAAARTFARKWCAEPPKTFDGVPLVVCAKLWDRSSDAEAWIDSHYTEMDCDAVMAGRPQSDPKASDAYGQLMGALHVSVPFTFSSADD